MLVAVEPSPPEIAIESLKVAGEAGSRSPVVPSFPVYFPRASDWPHVLRQPVRLAADFESGRLKRIEVGERNGLRKRRSK